MSPKPSPPNTSLAPAPPLPPVAPAHIRPLLGPPWLVDGEEPQLYEELLARAGAALEPQDVIDWLLVRDVVALSWEIQRGRRHRDALVRLGRKRAMVKILGEVYPRTAFGWPYERDREIEALASKWFAGSKKAEKTIQNMLAGSSLALPDIASQTLSANAEELDRIDRQTQRQEERRDRLLQQIERRRAGWAQRLRRAAEEIVDAEFAESPPELAIESAGAEAAQ